MSTLLLYVTIAGKIKCGWTREGLMLSSTTHVTDCKRHTVRLALNLNNTGVTEAAVVAGLFRWAAFDRKVICTFYCYRLSAIHIYASACSGSGRFRGSPNMSISIIARHFSESEGKYVFRELYDLFHALMGS